jgi:hypothetical protein
MGCFFLLDIWMQRLKNSKPGGSFSILVKFATLIKMQVESEEKVI